MGPLFHGDRGEWSGALQAMTPDNDLKDLQMRVSESRAEFDTSSTPRGYVTCEGCYYCRRDRLILRKDVKCVEGRSFRVFDVTTNNDAQAVDTVKTKKVRLDL